jgi:hypothetical protein
MVESELFEQGCRRYASDPVMTVSYDLGPDRGCDFAAARMKLVQRDQDTILQRGNLMFPRLADIDQEYRFSSDQFPLQFTNVNVLH